MFRAAVERAPDATAVTYFDGRLTVRDVDELTDALAQALLAEASTRATGGLSIFRMSALRPRLGHAQTIREWCRLTPDDVVLAVAPLIHITGLIAHVAVALLGLAELVLFYRATRTCWVDVRREHRPTFTVPALPVYITLASTPGVTADDLSSMSATYSGGAR